MAQSKAWLYIIFVPSTIPYIHSVSISWCSMISLGLFPEIWRVGVTTLGSLDADIIGGVIVLMYFR